MHYDTDIYEAAYQLFDVVETLVANMKRQYSRRIGDRLLDDLAEIMVLIVDVNTEASSKRRVMYLRRIIRRESRMALLLRFVKDKNLCAPVHHADAIALLKSVGKQASGWKKSELKKL